MGVGPSSRMRSLASRWLVDCVDLATVTPVTATRANMSDGVATIGTATRTAALVRQPAVTDTNTATADRSVRDLLVWIDDECVVAVAGMRCTIRACQDATLVDTAGTVLTVERDSLRAARRLTVRMGNDD